MSSDFQWVVLELTAKAEGEDPDLIVASIRHLIRDAEVFVPASVVQRDSIREFRYLVDGYAFIKHRHPDGHYLRLQDTKFVQSALYQMSGSGSRREKRLATVSDGQIATLRAQITVEVDQGIEVGDTVIITSGPYKNIRASVRDEIQEQDSVVVYIHLRSTERLVTLPRAFLKLESKSLHVGHRERLRRLGAWIDMAAGIAHWSEAEFLEVERRFEALRNLNAWVARSVALYRWFKAFYTPIQDLAPVLEKYRTLQTLSSFAARLSSTAVIPMEQKPELNLVVDGTQLYIRCAEALSDLTDREGRQTGGVVGFLRCVASYRKRFPRGSIYICWDGSSKRRKRMFDGYKGNRIARSEEPSFGWGWLREVLPMLGVHQAFNASEEADDVMATLVRGPLAGSTNLMITSDRDLLQVVSEFTHQLCPGSGGGREKLYDPATVNAEYGVAPAAMVELRALSGDASDHIPGVPGFGLKTALKALKPYGNVSALFQSNLAGLTKIQAANLRASAKQVMLNVDLMTLRDVPVTYIEPDSNQESARTRLKALGIRPDGVLVPFFGVSACAEATTDLAL